MTLKVRHLNKRYKTTTAISDVSFELTEGIYGFLGPNGAGKSTLINLITDNIRRDSGEILWDGQEICRLDKKYRDVIGYMPQYQGYYKGFTARAFLLYMAQMKGMKKKEAFERTDELLKTLNLWKVREKKAGSLSGGMRQRLMLAQALLNDPKLLILDEPTAGVDPQERIRIRNYISTIAKDKIILIATHIVSDVEAIANQIFLMGGGKVVEHCSPEALIAKVSPYTYMTTVKSATEIHGLEQMFIVSNIHNSEDGIQVKLIRKRSTDKEMDEAICHPVMANLEDVYLFYFSDRSDEV